jgi:hypothetical protein
VFDWESDYFSVTQDDKYIYEVEVKLSRADFFADFQKGEKHLWLSSATKHELVAKKTKPFGFYENVGKVETYALGYVKVRDNTPNRFYYCCPEGMIKKDEVPEYAGLLYLNKTGTYATQVKTAPFIHKNKNVERYLRKLVDKFYFQYIGMREEVFRAKRQNKDYDNLQKSNSRLLGMVDLAKNEGFIEEIEKLKKELNESWNENHKLKRQYRTLEMEFNEMKAK